MVAEPVQGAGAGGVRFREASGPCLRFPDQGSDFLRRFLTPTATLGRIQFDPDGTVLMIVFRLKAHRLVVGMQLTSKIKIRFPWISAGFS